MHIKTRAVSTRPFFVAQRPGFEAKWLHVHVQCSSSCVGRVNPETLSLRVVV